MKTSAVASQANGRGLLQEYRAKRNFRRTPEPAGEGRVDADGELMYCIQRHAARRLHYDFRLEWDGVLKSWAVPKGPSLDPSVKRLAVQTEDHPLEYGNFEGSIPTGEYGAGEVLLWDRGTWKPSGDAARALASGKLRFELLGEKLRGDWLLLRLEGDQWLLRKLDDEEARTGDGDRVIMERPESVRVTTTREVFGPRTTVRAPLPAFIPPQLATLASEPPLGDGWQYEIKYDGYRMGARITRDSARLFSRNGNDWAERLGQLAARIKSLRLGNGWLDGEIVVADGAGRTSFQALQKALDRDAGRIEFVVFDVLHWDGMDQRNRPLRERVALLEQIFRGVDAAGPVRLSQHLRGNGAEAWKAACRLGLEGLIAKRLDASYVNGRSDSWLKLKCRTGQEFVIGGFTDPAGSRTGFGALLVGVRAPDGQLDYSGRVGTGFNDSNLRRLRKRLDQLQIDRSPFRQPPRLRADRVHWVRPTLVAQVEFAEWTADGQLRQASFQGLREDKDARAIERELPRSATGRARSPQKVTHPDRIVYARPLATKLDVVRYYEEVAAVMLPHVRDRPLAMVRCPQGIAQPCFFQKHIGVKLPAGTRAIPIETATGKEDYVVIRDAAGIAGLAQYGTIEFHTWGSVASRLEYADRLTFDLDPDADVPWSRLVDAAVLIRDFIAEFGLTGFLKTTGGKGLHVVAPIKPTRDWDIVRSFTQGVAQQLAAASPDRYTARMAKARRTGRIFIDYLRNGRGATAISAYSLRAREGAPVSVPVPWEALSSRRDLRGERFNLRNLNEHLQWSVAAWLDYDKRRATLKLASVRALGTSSRRVVRG